MADTPSMTPPLPTAGPAAGPADPQAPVDGADPSSLLREIGRLESEADALDARLDAAAVRQTGQGPAR